MPHEERWLIVGGDSTIGSALARSAGRRAICTSRRPASDNVLSLDLAGDPASWVLPERVDVAFLCAAVTSIKVCRSQPVETRLVNVERTVHLAERLTARGAFVVLLSTNQVFDGSKPYRSAEESPCPLTEYGRQKADAERAILAMGGAAVRFTKVMAGVPALFLAWEEALTKGEPISPFADMVFSPVPLAFAVDALIAVGTRRVGGIVQVSGDCDVSYADAARRLAERLNADPGLVQPAFVASRGIAPEAAPRHTTLDTSGLAGIGLRVPLVSETLGSSIRA